MTKGNAEYMRKIFEGLEEVDFTPDDHISWNSCLRIRAVINVNKPLYEGFANKRPHGSLERFKFRPGKRQEFGRWRRAEIFPLKNQFSGEESWGEKNNTTNLLRYPTPLRKEHGIPFIFFYFH
ncbi:uncharacterized protein LOC131183138 [Hevea brasiliensis]|uniref:uncharacterized protein LOC131183138 n=1 Tax=Hevea brasiliensis TaxID=3981 RepID=UPI0025D9ECBA|nr:uncharacterized protein LOC131183138 [Hevea brasiliensis]